MLLLHPGPGAAAPAQAAALHPGRGPSLAASGCSPSWRLPLAAVALYSQRIHLSGDEPHYIIVAQSLVEDGDFDLKNNLDPGKYSTYMPVEIRFHGSVRDGRYHSFHLPGVSFLLVPFFFLFKLLDGAVPGQPVFPPGRGLDQFFFRPGAFPGPANQPAGKKRAPPLHFFPGHVPAGIPGRAPFPGIARRRPGGLRLSFCQG